MKQAMQAVATIALVVGFAATAQAGDTYRQGAAQATNRPVAATEMRQHTTVGREQIKEAQQQLKAEGLFKGQIDGRMTSQFKLAISKFQQQNGLKRTAKLDQETLARLTAGGTAGAQTGVGSSMPGRSETTMPGAPATQPSPSGAGSTTAPSSTSPGHIGSPKQP